MKKRLFFTFKLIMIKQNSLNYPAGDFPLVSFRTQKPFLSGVGQEPGLNQYRRAGCLLYYQKNARASRRGRRLLFY